MLKLRPTLVHALGVIAVVALCCVALSATGRSTQSPAGTRRTSETAFAVSADHRGPPVERTSLLGTAASFAVLAGSTVRSSGRTVLTGHLGAGLNTAITGFQPGVVNGTIHAGDAVAAQAQAAVATAFDALTAMTCHTNLTGQDLGGRTLRPGVYCFDSSARLTGILALDARGDPDAVFVFKVGSTLTTAANASVLLFNGAKDCNVYWQLGGSATVGTRTAFAGNILATENITLMTGASLTGRALARTGAVAMNGNMVAASDCGGGAQADCHEKVTGGGSILVDGGMAKFGFVVRRYGRERARGELRYENHVTGDDLLMNRFCSFVVTGNTATFTGTGRLNGLSGSFTVTAVDGREPGENDRFTIAVAGGPTDSGVVRLGDIHIHAKQCGNGDDDGDGSSRVARK